MIATVLRALLDPDFGVHEEAYGSFPHSLSQTKHSKIQRHHRVQPLKGTGVYYRPGGGELQSHHGEQWKENQRLESAWAAE